ncbi:unnamed protein product [Allacma fusca]|uniref:Uncharacterized protein n=1 Tax=Allacma fusca TaxID=39272 RepID=A0A8J2L1T8_9HEXA|nr:unnamed protein product [Allacma fusca]
MKLSALVPKNFFVFKTTFYHTGCILQATYEHVKDGKSVNVTTKYPSHACRGTNHFGASSHGNKPRAITASISGTSTSGKHNIKTPYKKDSMEKNKYTSKNPLSHNRRLGLLILQEEIIPIRVRAHVLLK